jgi:hypothetical protein
MKLSELIDALNRIKNKTDKDPSVFLTINNIQHPLQFRCVSLGEAGKTEASAKEVVVFDVGIDEPLMTILAAMTCFPGTSPEEVLKMAQEIHKLNEELDNWKDKNIH